MFLLLHGGCGRPSAGTLPHIINNFLIILNIFVQSYAFLLNLQYLCSLKIGNSMKKYIPDGF